MLSWFCGSHGLTEMASFGVSHGVAQLGLKAQWRFDCVECPRWHTRIWLAVDTKAQPGLSFKPPVCGLSGLGFLQHDGWVLGESPLKINIPETQVEAERLLMIQPYKSPNITSTWLLSSKVSHRPSPDSRGGWYERM